MSVSTGSKTVRRQSSRGSTKAGGVAAAVLILHSFAVSGPFLDPVYCFVQPTEHDLVLS